MFDSEDFELPLEKQLKIRVINTEIDECRDVEALQVHLKECSLSLMKYQHLLSQVIRKQMMKELQVMSPEAFKIVDEVIDDFNGKRE